MSKEKVAVKSVGAVAANVEPPQTKILAKPMGEVVATSVEPLPPQEAPPQPDVKAIDAKTVMFMIYTLYKLNLITRLQVRDFLELVKSNKVPADLTQYLVDEVKKI